MGCPAYVNVVVIKSWVIKCLTLTVPVGLSIASLNSCTGGGRSKTPMSIWDHADGSRYSLWKCGTDTE